MDRQTPAPEPLPSAGTSEDDDARLVQRCRAGDAQAWALLVRRYQRLVYTVVMRAGLDTHGAADVFQTVFSRLVEQLPQLQDPSRLRAWIVTTARREAFLQVERARRWVSNSAGDDGQTSDGQAPLEPADPTAGPEALLDEWQQLEALREALGRLDDRCRTLLGELFADEDRPDYAAIALRLSMPVGSIGPTRSRCLDKLRRLLAAPPKDGQ